MCLTIADLSVFSLLIGIVYLPPSGLQIGVKCASCSDLCDQPGSSGGYCPSHHKLQNTSITLNKAAPPPAPVLSQDYKLNTFGIFESAVRKLKFPSIHLFYNILWPITHSKLYDSFVRKDILLLNPQQAAFFCISILKNKISYIIATFSDCKKKLMEFMLLHYKSY